MYKFWAVIIALVILEEIAEFIYKAKSKAYKNSRSGYAHIHGEIPDGLEIVNIGSGPGLCGIGYEYCDKRGFNFSTAPQNFKNGFRLLKRFSQKINSNAIVIILLMCPMSFGRNNDYNSPGYSDKFYGVLPSNEIDGYSYFRAFRVKHPFMFRVLGKIKRIFMNKPVQVPVQKNNEDNKPGLITTWTREFKLENLVDPSQAQAHRDIFCEKIAILSEEIEYCKANNWRPVFVIPPVPENARKFISNEFANAFFYDNVKTLAQKFPDVKILDYFADTRISESMFNGDIFLNSEGRKKFSQILFADIEKECE